MSSSPGLAEVLHVAGVRMGTLGVLELCYLARE